MSHPERNPARVIRRREPLVSLIATVCRAALASSAACVLIAAPAHAAATTAAPGCPVKPTVQPFAPWQDLADYVLAPGGDLERNRSTWTLAGGAAAVEGNEPFQVGAATDHTSLSLPAGSSATTAQMCIGIEHKTMRFFAKANTSSGSLRVEVLLAGRGGRTRAVSIGTIKAGTDWAPTAELPMIVNKLAPKHGNAIQVAFRFTPRSSAGWTIDDVYVDPYRSR